MDGTTTPVTPTEEEVVTPEVPATEGMPEEAAPEVAPESAPEAAPEAPAEETPAV